MISQNGTDGRVYGGDCELIHVADGQRATMGAILADDLNRAMRQAAFDSGARNLYEAGSQPLCPGCYMVVGFDMLVSLAKRNGQSMRELGLTMAQAFTQLAECDPEDAGCIESIHVIIDSD